MKKNLLFLIVIFTGFAAFSQSRHTISNDGLLYTPAQLAVNVGDTVVFNVGSFHPTLQVSESTWNSNGSDALSGGFDFPNGSGTIVISGTNTIYYICTAHISSGMKGTIEVSATSGIPELSFGKDYKIFPNPVLNNELTISFKNDLPEGLEIKMYDLTGKEIMNEKYVVSKNQNKEIFVSLKGINKGTYLLEMKGNTYFSVAKIIVD